jgi:hypothetical protein
MLFSVLGLRKHLAMLLALTVDSYCYSELKKVAYGDSEPLCAYVPELRDLHGTGNASACVYRLLSMSIM